MLTGHVLLAQVFEKLRGDMEVGRRLQQQLQRERDEARKRADKSDKQVGAARAAAGCAVLCCMDHPCYCSVSLA